MRALIDIVHPAHVHFYRYLYADLTAAGHEVTVASREREVTTDLLDRFEIPHQTLSHADTTSLRRSGAELFQRVRALRHLIQRSKIDVVLTRNPGGVQAAKLSRATGVFDTDDGSAVGIHFRAAKPFADVITTPACLREDFGDRHYRYPGFKALAYLHPERFTPDPDIRQQLGVAEDEPLFVVRFSAHGASHDRRISGIPPHARSQLLAELSARGMVIVSDEVSRGQMGESALPLPPDRLHDVLAAADLCVGDSQSVAAEAAVLGTPAFRLSSFSGRVDYLAELERYGLVSNYRPGEEAKLLQGVREAIRDLAQLAVRTQQARTRMLSESVDVTSWYHNLLATLMRQR